MKKIIQLSSEILNYPWLYEGWKKWSDKCTVVSSVEDYNKDIP